MSTPAGSPAKRRAGTRAGSPKRRPRTSAASPLLDAAAVRKAHSRLARRFGPLDPPVKREPLEELILTVLSQNTSDVNRDRAFTSLRKRFGTWQEVLDAPAADVADAIRPGGLANTKAPRIQAILRAIEGRTGSLDLGFLETMTDGEVREYLETLPGVGPKTAACVLAFSLERPALPVDTHVYRTAQRLGYLPPKTTPDAAHDVMNALVPPKLRVSMHVGLIRLGRAICKPGRPRCEDCPLQDLCPTAPQILAAPGSLRGRKKSG